MDLFNSECDLLHYEIYVGYRKNLLPQYDDLLKELEETHHRLDKLKHQYQV